MLVAVIAVHAADDRILSRSCGTASPELEIAVIDRDTRAAIPDARITFYDQGDLALLQFIDYLRRTQAKEIPAALSGVTATADANGRATLRCTFAFTKLAFASGAARIEVFPEGRFRVACALYSEFDVEATALLPHAPYAAKLPRVEVVMKKTEPN